MVNNDQNFSKILDEAIEFVEDLDLKRERVIKLSRKLNRISGKGIALLVKGKNADDELRESKSFVEDLNFEMISLAPFTSWNVTSQGVEEYIEFRILNSILEGEQIPSYQSLKVPASLWLLGLGDVIGELRRIVLNLLLDRKIDQAREHLKSMEEIFEGLTGLAFSKTIVGSLRKKIDTGRVLLERTASDMLNVSLK